ncbi:hypothetical protein KCU83_g649, partial [Aureobasidium melanogenum]
LHDVALIPATHKPVPKEFGAVEFATFFVGKDYKVSNADSQKMKVHSHLINQDVLQGPEYRPFAKLAKRPGSDSLRVFNHIVLKISQQSIRTCDAMLPHLIYKITNVCEPPASTRENSLDATSAVLFEVISLRLQLGNDLHMTFKRVGKNTINCLERLREQNEEWSSIWNGGLKQFEPETVKLGLNQIKNAMLNLERMMVGCLRTIHTHQKKKGWLDSTEHGYSRSMRVFSFRSQSCILIAACPRCCHEVQRVCAALHSKQKAVPKSRLRLSVRI